MRILKSRQHQFFAICLAGFWYVQDFKGTGFVRVEDPYTSAGLTMNFDKPSSPDHYRRKELVV